MSSPPVFTELLEDGANAIYYTKLVNSMSSHSGLHSFILQIILSIRYYLVGAYSILVYDYGTLRSYLAGRLSKMT